MSALSAAGCSQDDARSWPENQREAGLGCSRGPLPSATLMVGPARRGSSSRRWPTWWGTWVGRQPTAAERLLIDVSAVLVQRLRCALDRHATGEGEFKRLFTGKP